MTIRERRNDHFGIGTNKKIKEGERRKGHVARRRRVGMWEEISHLVQIGEREEKRRKKKKEWRRKIEEENGRGKERISWCFDGRNSTVRELKLVNVA